MHGSGRVKIVDVAAAAGVSVTTVSHVISGRRPVSAATRARVEDAVHRLGYQADPSARGLRTQRTDTIGLVVPDITNPFNTELAAGIQEIAYAHDLLTVVCEAPMSGGPQLPAVLRQLTARRLDGIVLGRFGARRADLDLIAASGTRLVRLGTRIADGPGDVVRGAETEGMRALVEHLVGERGYRRVGFIGGEPGVEPGGERYEGYRQALAAAGHAVLPELTVWTGFTREGGRAGAARLLDAAQPPDAVVCANDLIAIGVLDVARQRGLAVPGNLAVAGYDDIDAASMVSPALTTVVNPAREIGRSAARLLIDRIAGDTGPAREVVLAHQVVLRGSA
ncbi:LacI family DNA-binding transcriptional regulator [Streptomyces sp. AcE210]|uniref:LacI family DNA-binding transcriptional regulator n=1 Tax=Streptomyces sp. AcE210 TaxID=2292703 RepID=UPI000E305F6E|nr:LacI family DNA-binding transcriptional regulator [Streptomyces sp. AcE210]RFC70848.1 LacI family transcriptional regulator [Streptomyces sp. AcE210]